MPEDFSARVPTASLLRRMFRGAGLAGVLGCAACAGWRVARPDSPLPGIATVLTLAALGGAVGGAVFHYLEPLRQQGRGWKIAADVAGGLGYAVIVAVALVLGWNAAP